MCLLVPMRAEHADGDPRFAVWPAWRPVLRGLHPKLPEAPFLVDAHLAVADVGGQIHLQHHIREVVVADLYRMAEFADLARVQVEHVVRLLDDSLPPLGIAEHQIPAAVGLDRRTPRRRDPLRQAGEPPPRQLVVDAGRLARRPGDLGLGIPVLEPTFIVRDVLARDANRPTAREAVCDAFVVRWWSIRRRFESLVPQADR